jgi:manganese/zinc/iron transport system permease protein
MNAVDTLLLAQSRAENASAQAFELFVRTAELLGVEYNTLLVLVTTALLGAVSGVVGCFAVLRRRALTGDALAHAALPGLCVAFLVAGVRSVPIMLLGALASGVLGIGIIVALRRWTRVKEDAAIGIVLSVFFGAGIVLSRMIQNSTTTGNKAGLDSFILGKTSGIQLVDLGIVGAVSVLCLLLIAAAFKEFRLVSFDAAFARAQGWPVAIVDFALLAMIAVVVVIGLPTVGVVLMAALLIIPGAAARFWTERLEKMTLLAAAFGLTIGIVGAAASAHFEGLPTGPIIVLAGTTLFLISATIAPRRGGVARWLSGRQFANRVAVRRLIGTMYMCDYAGGERRTWLAEPGTVFSGQSAREYWSAIHAARRQGLIALHEHNVELTDAGQAAAVEALRDERLWQLLLVEYPELAVGAADPFHSTAAEVLPAEIVEELVNQLRAAGRWPEPMKATSVEGVGR